MSFPEEDLITVQETAKKLNISLDQVMFRIEDGRLIGYIRHPQFGAQEILAQFAKPSDPLQTKLQKWLKIKLPIWWSGDGVQLKSTFGYLINRPINSIVLNSKEVDFLVRKQSHSKKNKFQDDDSLDLVIRCAVKVLEELGKPWNYSDVIRKIKWLCGENEDVADRVKSVNVKTGDILWFKGAWKKESSSRKTLQQRLTVLYPKKYRTNCK